MNQIFPARTRLALISLALMLCTGPPSQAADTPLDTRRLAVLELFDAELNLGPQDARYPAPNRTLSGSADQSDYLAKTLAVFALVQQGRVPAARSSEANALLRYMIHNWPATAPNDLIGQYASTWNHRDRSLAMRLYCLYKESMDPDIRQEFDNRMLLALADPYQQSSENIKATTNSLIYLAHEAAGQTSRPSYASIRSWWIDKLRSFGNEGFFEWGSPYHFWTMGAVQNLAELAQDEQVRTLATMVIDYTLGCMAGFSIDHYFNSAAIRRWYWTYCLIEPHTPVIQTLFTRVPAYDFFLWLEWSASDYRPPTIVDQMYSSARGSETRVTLVDRWHLYSYVMDRAAISTHQTLVDDYYGNPGETHDIIQCIIQSTAGDTSHVITYAIQPGMQKYRCLHDRSFGRHNVAIVNGGGFTRKAWSGGTLSNVPIRLFLTKTFTASFDAGWAFVTDGNVYVAWAPTIGNPIADPESATLIDATGCGGSLLRSDYTPTDVGEAAVVEVGDPESFGSYAAFKNEVKGRNPRPRWSSDKVVYTARDGTVLEFGTTYAKVNGVNVDLTGYPRAASTLGIDGDTFSVNGQTVRFDFAAGRTSGPLERVSASRFYGPRPVPSDFDHDGDVDQEDFGKFQACYNEALQPVPPGCESADFDGNTVVNRIDFDQFLACMGGPGLPPSCSP